MLLLLTARLLCTRESRRLGEQFTLLSSKFIERNQCITSLHLTLITPLTGIQSILGPDYCSKGVSYGASACGVILAIWRLCPSSQSNNAVWAVTRFYSSQHLSFYF